MSGTHLALVGLGRDRKVNSRPDNWWRYPWFADLLAQQKDPSTLWFYMDFTSVQNEARFFWKVTIPRGSVWTSTSLTMDRTVYITCNMDYDTGQKWSSCPLPVAAQVIQRKLHTIWPGRTDGSNSPSQASQETETTVPAEARSGEMATTPSSTKTGKSTAKIRSKRACNGAASD